MADANRPLSQEEIDALLNAIGSNTLDIDEPGGSSVLDDAGPVESLQELGMAAQLETGTSEPINRQVMVVHDPRVQRTMHLPVTLSVSLGIKNLPVKSLLSWGIGTQVVLNHEWQDSVQVKVNGLEVGRARVVLVGNNFGVEITRWGRGN